MTLNAKYAALIVAAAIVAVLVAIAVWTIVPHDSSRPVVYIVYDSAKGDLSYSDSAYRGLFEAQENLSFDKREFTSLNAGTVAGLLDGSSGTQDQKPGLVITVGYTYANMTASLARAHPEIRFLAIDQAGIGSQNVKAYEITSYGESYLAGVLAATATKSGHTGIILGTQSSLLEAFRQGYEDGAKAVNPAIRIDEKYVRDNSTAGFRDPTRAAEIARTMYGSGADVIYTVAGYSGTGAIEEAKTAPGRYIIGVDSDQTDLGPDVVLASAVKQVDGAVYSGIAEQLNGTFTGGEETAGLKDGVTALVFNPKFESYNATVSAWVEKAEAAEAGYVAGNR
ncbi:MAG: BMP family ABC transporter substrate-binding protein [Methanoregula sp.]|nr:BMP family ABC transporter substrate-binding protein [Methanoregula sp.]